MSWEGYQKLEVSGSWLKPGFCIYLMDISHTDKRFFYIGMTGDPNYPSARAAFHRLSGHLELTHHSTQNQLKTAFDQNNMRIEDCHITMHHFPIGGFTPWKLSSMKWEELNKYRTTPEYLAYKKHQQKVLQLEKALIYTYSQQLGNRLLNRTKGKQYKTVLQDFKAMTEQLNTIIN